MAKVSVIIPVYNVEKYLRKCLDSVVNQTLADIEVICVDDCSTDESLKILKEYSNKDSRIKIIEQEQNQGQGEARNLALSQACGEYIMFLDPDDWLELDACETAYNSISANKNDFVIFDFYEYFEKNKKRKLCTYRTKPFKDFFDTNGFDVKNVKTNYLVNSFTCCIIFSRKFLVKNDIKYADLRLGEDVTFFIKSIINSSNINVILKPLYNYRIRKDSSSFNTNNWKDTITAREMALDIILNSEYKDIFLPKYRVYVIRTIIFWFKRFSQEQTIAEECYKSVQNFFIHLNSLCDFSDIKNCTEYNEMCLFINNKTYVEYRFFKFIRSMFSIELNQDKTRKIIHIAGVKLTVKN